MIFCRTFDSVCHSVTLTDFIPANSTVSSKVCSMLDQENKTVKSVCRKEQKEKYSVKLTEFQTQKTFQKIKISFSWQNIFVIREVGNNTCEDSGQHVYQRSRSQMKLSTLFTTLRIKINQCTFRKAIFHFTSFCVPNHLESALKNKQLFSSRSRVLTRRPDE